MCDHERCEAIKKLLELEEQRAHSWCAGPSNASSYATENKDRFQRSCGRRESSDLTAEISLSSMPHELQELALHERRVHIGAEDEENEGEDEAVVVEAQDERESDQDLALEESDDIELSLRSAPVVKFDEDTQRVSVRRAHNFL